MGDTADLMIEGVLCECCGEYIGDAVGYPRKCSDCAAEEQEEEKTKPKKEKNDK